MELALDTGATELADGCARQLAANFWEYPDGQRQGVAVLVALHAAWTLEDRELIEAWLPHSVGGLVRQDCARALLAAESCRLAGDFDGMRTNIDQSRAALDSVIDEASRSQFSERLDYLTGLAASNSDSACIESQATPSQVPSPEVERPGGSNN